MTKKLWETLYLLSTIWMSMYWTYMDFIRKSQKRLMFEKWKKTKKTYSKFKYSKEVKSTLEQPKLGQ